MVKPFINVSQRLICCEQHKTIKVAFTMVSSGGGDEKPVDLMSGCRAYFDNENIQ